MKVTISSSGGDGPLDVLIGEDGNDKLSGGDGSDDISGGERQRSNAG